MKKLRWWALLVGFLYTVLLCVFCVADAVAAGNSAEMAWQVMGMDPRTMALHQVWLLSARTAVSLKLFSPEITLNALSAVFAGAALSGVLVVFYRLLTCAMSSINVATLFLVNDDAPEGIEQRRLKSAREVTGILIEEFSRNEKRALLFGTLAAGIAFAFTAPLWVNATRAGPASFDILLVLLAVWTTCSFCLRPGHRSAFVASAVSGIGLAESPLFIAVGVALAFFYMRTVLQNDLDVQRYFLIAVGSMVAAFMLQLVLASYLLGESLGAAVPLTQVVRAMINGHYRALLSIPTSPYWMWSILWAGIPFVIAMSLSLSAQSAVRLNYVLCLTLGSVALALVLLNFPYTPWWIWHGNGEASIVTSLLVVFSCGFLTCRWWLLATVKSPMAGMTAESVALDVERGEIMVWYFWRFSGISGFAVAVLLLAWQPLQNWKIVDPQALQVQTETEHDALGPLVMGEFTLPVDATADALATLAMEMLEEGRIDEVEQVILARLPKMKPPLGRDRMELLRARVLMRRGERHLESARIFLLRLLPRDLPERVAIGNWLLETDLAKQDWSLVERDAQTIRKLMPLHLMANEMLGRALVRRGAPRLAIGHLHEVMQVITNAALLTVHGEAAYKLGEFDEALSVLQQAAQLGEASGESYILLAMTLLQLGETNKAETVLQSVSERQITPDLVLFHADLRHNRGDIEGCHQLLMQSEKLRDQLTLMQRRRWDSLLIHTVDVVPVDKSAAQRP